MFEFQEGVLRHGGGKGARKKGGLQSFEHFRRHIRKEGAFKVVFLHGYFNGLHKKAVILSRFCACRVFFSKWSNYTFCSFALKIGAFVRVFPYQRKTERLFTNYHPQMVQTEPKSWLRVRPITMKRCLLRNGAHTLCLFSCKRPFYSDILSP